MGTSPIVRSVSPDMIMKKRNSALKFTEITSSENTWQITCAIWRKKMMRPIKDNSLSTSKTALLPIPSKACTQRLMLLFERTRKPWQKNRQRRASPRGGTPKKITLADRKAKIKNTKEEFLAQIEAQKE